MNKEGFLREHHEALAPQYSAELVDAMRSNAENPMAEDRVMAAFYAAAVQKVEERRDFRDIVDNLAARPDLDTPHAMYLLLRGFQKQMLRKSSRYPAPELERADGWASEIDGILDSRDGSKEVLIDDLKRRHLQTNVSDRYKSLRLIMGWMQAAGRAKEHPTILDIGCSQNHGLKKLALVGEIKGLEFSPTSVVQPAKKQVLGSARTKKDTVTTEKIMRLQNEPIGPTISKGIDSENMYDPDTIEWSRSCLYPKEFQDETILNYYVLDASKPDGVSFEQINLLDDQQTKFLEVSQVSEGNFDIVTMYTMLYQMSDRDRYKMLRQARRYVSPDGVLVVQDFAQVYGEAPAELVFFPKWIKPYRYRTIVLDMQKPEGYQELFLWESGRCQKMQLAMGRLAVGQDSMSFTEYLEDQPS